MFGLIAWTSAVKGDAVKIRNRAKLIYDREYNFFKFLYGYNLELIDD